MIEFLSEINNKKWSYPSVEDLQKIDNGEIEGVIPDAETPITAIMLNGKNITEDVIDYTFWRIGTDTVWIEDLMFYLNRDACPSLENSDKDKA